MVRIYDSVDYPLLYLGLYERAIECLLVRQECNGDKIMLFREIGSILLSIWAADTLFSGSSGDGSCHL